MTALTVAMTEHEARRVTERIRAIAVTVKDQLEKLQTLLNEARDGEAWRALGYASWTAYLADVMGEQPLRLPRDERQQIVGYLAGEGMSSRAIAPIVGAGHVTVTRDIARVSNETPAPTVDYVTDQADLDEAPELPDEGAGTPRDSGDAEPSEDEGLPVPSPSSRSVTGLDGKQYARPERKPTGDKERPGSAMSATEADQDRQVQEARDLSRALLTLAAFQYPQARNRYRESWNAQPYARGNGEQFYNPTTIRLIAKSLTTFATELEEA